MARRCLSAMFVVICTVVLVLCGYTEVVGGAKSRPRPPPRKVVKPTLSPLDEIQSKQRIDVQKMTGTWYLLIVASKCPFLINHGNEVQPTFMTLTQSSDEKLSVRIKTRHNHQCWEILQAYHLTSTSGKFILNGSRSEMDTEIFVTETDYTSYAVIIYRKYGKITMKLFSRSTDDLSESMLSKFEQEAEKQGFGLAYHFPFPNYSHCGDTDQDHVINCVPTC